MPGYVSARLMLCGLIHGMMALPNDGIAIWAWDPGIGRPGDTLLSCHDDIGPKGQLGFEFGTCRNLHKAPVGTLGYLRIGKTTYVFQVTTAGAAMDAASQNALLHPTRLAVPSISLLTCYPNMWDTGEWGDRLALVRVVHAA